MTKTKKQHSNNKYTVINAIVGILFLATIGGLIYCATNMKTEEDQQYLDLKDHLFSKYIDERCENSELHRDEKNIARVCYVVGDGISKDGDVYIEFMSQDYDKETGLPINEEEHNTLYFQHSSSSIDGYAEALGN